MSALNPHPDPEELAAVAVGDPDVGVEVRAHVGDCAECAADVAAINGVLRSLRELPELRMPVDVVTAVERALADEPAAVAPASLAAARARRGRLMPFAAAASAVGLAAVLGTTVLRTNDQRSTDAGDAATDSVAGAEAAPGPRILTSGTDYREAELDFQVRDALTAPPAAAALSAEDSAAGRGAGTADAPLGSTEQSSARTAPALTPEQLQSCVDELSGAPGSSPLLVDYASYAGRPAVVVVLPFREDTVDVFVVRSDCRVGNDALIYFKRVRTP